MLIYTKVEHLLVVKEAEITFVVIFNFDGFGVN